MSLGQRVRHRRQALKITQQDMAQSLGVTPQYISLIEHDQAAPSLTMLPKLAEVLGASADYILSGKESVVTDTIPAIKGDKSLTLNLKRALIAMVEEFRVITSKEASSSPSDCDGEPSKEDIQTPCPPQERA